VIPASTTVAPLRRAWVEQVMGLPVSIHVRGPGVHGAGVDRAVAAAFGILREMDRVFSTWQHGSDVMRLRRGEVDLAGCDPLVAASVRLGAEAARVTGGAFTTLLPDGGDLVFDPTGLVKGWAVDRATLPLLDLPGVSFCVNAGGDLVVGAHTDLPDDGPGAVVWRIGIEDPSDRSRVAAAVPVTRGAVATSGTAARGAHLYDPVRDRMVGRAGSTTVHGPTLLWADVWATALFVGDAGTRDLFARHAPAYRALELPA
jgi:thiamine biosynthesis lipoprotein